MTDVGEAYLGRFGIIIIRTIKCFFLFATTRIGIFSYCFKVFVFRIE